MDTETQYLLCRKFWN